MKNTIIITALLLCGITAAWSQTEDLTVPVSEDTSNEVTEDTIAVKAAKSKVGISKSVPADNVSIERDGGNLSVDMNLDLTGLGVKRNRAMLLTPRLVNGEDSVEMPSIGVYGRKRYYYYVRNGESLLTGSDGMSYRASSTPDTLDYHQTLQYEDWMDGSVLALHREDYGCCNSLIAEWDSVLSYYERFVPQIIYVRPQGDGSKTRSLEGSAYIDFPVNKTEIYPDYRNNPSELAKIRATIDSVRNDKDVTITSVWLKGYASPEGPYYHNRDLAKGRTAALSEYIQQQYSFGDGVITTEFEPEDWAGMRRFVESSGILNKEAILAVIDDTEADIDEKEKGIKASYPEEYKLLLSECYPALRHTDYRIGYNIRTYTDVEEIKRILREEPSKLSLNELYLVAQEYEPGTPEFTEIFETAVRMFPNDETANLNAANAALEREDTATASRYLAKAGESGEAEYARGVCAYLEGDSAASLEHLRKAEKAGVTEARDMIGKLKIKNAMRQAECVGHTQM